MSDPNTFRKIWGAFTNVVTAVTIAWLISWALAETYATGGPVIETSDFQLLTPQVPERGAVTFSVWRKSFESCPGTVVMVYISKDKDIDSVPDNTNEVVSVRYPLSTPGFNSPPRLTITRQIPRQVTAGLWRVTVGVDSDCPTRTRYDPTAEFDLEVYRVPSSG